MNLSLERAVASVCTQVCSPRAAVWSMWAHAQEVRVPLYSLGGHGHMPCSLGPLGIQGDPGTLMPFLGILFGALPLLSGLTSDWTYGKHGGHLTPSLLWTSPCLVLLGVYVAPLYWEEGTTGSRALGSRPLGPRPGCVPDSEVSQG